MLFSGLPVASVSTVPRDCPIGVPPDLVFAARLKPSMAKPVLLIAVMVSPRQSQTSESVKSAKGETAKWAMRGSGGFAVLFAPAFFFPGICAWPLSPADGK